MEIFGETIERELPDLAEQGVRSGSSAAATARPDRSGAQMEALEAETAGNDRLELWIAFDYGGRAELVEAARRLVEDGVAARRDRRGRRSPRSSTRPSCPIPTS